MWWRIPTSRLIDRIREGGATLFASHDYPAFTVIEYDTPVRGNATA